MVVASTVLLGSFWIGHQYRQFLSETRHLREDYLATQQAELKQEIGGVVDFINYQKSTTRKRLESTLRDRVHEAHAIATNIYKKYQAEKTPEEIKAMVREALRPIRFNNGRGYYFATRMNGIEELFADRPSLEGRSMLRVRGGKGEYVVRDMIALVRKSGEGFYEYYWTKPHEKGTMHPKVAFVKHFRPFNWFIGTGEYLDDFTRDIQKEVLSRIDRIRFGHDGYIFAGTLEGDILAGPGTGRNHYHMTDQNGVKIVQEFISLAGKGGGFVTYMMPPIDGKKSALKMSYVTKIDEWGWFVGAGSYMEDVENIIKNRRDAVFKKTIRGIALILALLVCSILFSYLLSRRVARSLKSDFDTLSTFFQRAAADLVAVDSTAVKFSEFEELAHSINEMVYARKEAETALRASEEKFQTVADFTYDWEFWVGPDGSLIYISPSCERISGYRRDEFLDDKELIDRIVYPDDRPAYEEFIKRSFGKDWSRVTETEYRIVRKDGQVRWVAHLGSPVLASDGKFLGRRASNRDITDRKRAEEEKRALEGQFLQSQKMEAIGTLAGGIAHDFNNLLMGIQGYASLMLYDVEPSHPHAQKLKRIEDLVKNGADLTRQLLGFARRGKYEVVLCNLNDIVQKTAFLFGRTRKEITIEFDLFDELAYVDADRGQMEQVLFNMYVNSGQAMPGGGELHLSSENISVGEQDAARLEIRQGSYVRITIADTGIGMDEKTISRIFEPFFTTQDMSTATGLGLASAYGIIRNHGGCIDVESQKGKGTSFMIYLPVSEKKLSREVVLPKVPARGDGTILLIDDQDVILNVGKEMLSALGYSVITAQSGDEALQIYQAEKEAVDLIILDMIMPNMGGGEVFNRLKEIDPNVVVLLSSGYSLDMQASEILERGCKGFIQKPFDIQVLSERIRIILDRKIQ